MRRRRAMNKDPAPQIETHAPSSHTSHSVQWIPQQGSIGSAHEGSSGQRQRPLPPAAPTDIA